MAVNTKTDPVDGLPAIEAQDWAEEKHEHLRQYIDISREARRKFLRGPGAGASYCELFCGPGRLFHGSRFFDGSPLVAFKESARTGTAFTHLHLGDEQQEFCAAVEQRLQKLGAKVQTHPLKADAAAKRIVRALDDAAINLAFLDPFNLGDLPFSILETFSRLRRIDLVIHVSAMDLIRQMPAALKSGSRTFDRFAPGWQEAVKGLSPGEEARGRFIEHWLGLIRRAGYKDAKVWKLIRGPTNQPLYWLVLVAKHQLAATFWDKVGKSPQGKLDF
ncbi:MAG TPA: three-Cys-motif partner protein TcmP [Burkholderiales bacterium]